jgi:hypothetical protein
VAHVLELEQPTVTIPLQQQAATRALDITARPEANIVVVPVIFMGETVQDSDLPNPPAQQRRFVFASAR